MVNTTTIRVSEKIKGDIENLKEHPRETYEEVIERIIKLYVNDRYGGYDGLFLSPK